MPDDLPLDRLAPTVDREAAAASFSRLRRRRKQRRRGLVSGVAVLVVVGLVGAIALATKGHRRDQDVQASGPRRLDGKATQPFDAVKTTGPVRMTLHLPDRQALVGRRLWVDVAITNVSTRAISYTTGPDKIAASVLLRPEGSDASAADADPRRPQDFHWSGRVSDLAGALPYRPYRPNVARGVEERFVGQRRLSERKVALNQTLRPGQTLRQRMALDVRVRVGALPNDGRDEVTAAFDGYVFDPYRCRGPANACRRYQPQRPAVAAPVRLVDDPRRDATAGAAITALSAGRAVAQWAAPLRSMRLSPAVLQAFSIELTWWLGGWEQWSEPAYADGNPGVLRARWDAKRHQVVDVRAVDDNSLAPDDDPDLRPDNPMNKPDTVYFTVGKAASAAGFETVTRTSNGVRMVLRLPRSRPRVGERLWTDLTITNVSNKPISWADTGDGGAFLQLRMGDGTTGPIEFWNGDVSTLAERLRRGRTAPRIIQAISADLVPLRAEARVATVRPSVLRPGMSLHQRTAFDVRVGIGPAPVEGQLLAEFTSVTNPARLEAVVHLRDDPRRERALADAAADMPAAPVLQRWVLSRLAIKLAPGAHQEFTTTWTWWLGGPELWISPKFGNGGELRVRWDVDRRKVVDVRRVELYEPADDDPDLKPGAPFNRPDVVYFHQP